VVNEHLVDAQLQCPSQRRRLPAEVGRHEDAGVDVIGTDVPGCLLELFDALEIGHEHGVEDVGPPLIEGGRPGLVVGGGPGHLGLHPHRLSLAASVAEGVEDRS
jgi:hypothetical protein